MDRLDSSPAPGRGQHLCLTDLLDQDTTSYEFFYAQPESVRQKIRTADPSSFEEMQQVVSTLA
ncbi:MULTISPECIES: hypothetical protein [Caproicibacterium]|jgi:hypothetical protein|uniref:Uncharacterized protein n=1 Tax=Caproicibacterium lactatifermentans TaxID=2666138 RepID=A0A859DQK0_9FIRM|nr:hypothetical protein [Caproicibacterium lactatifermentans]ARP50482.1 hypothetical protein B6259_06095 [Ruminococcaceae bacterium CPB6]QKN23799.1 hypothetical protein GJQ69_04470 [Caproicibacterium lactatifermentans]QKO29565.1 hypothetical protein GKP14_00105 [Caproicibacterium lactatifermentans]